MGIKQKDENSAGGLHNAFAAGTTIKGNIITETTSLGWKSRGRYQLQRQDRYRPQR